MDSRPLEPPVDRTTVQYAPAVMPLPDAALPWGLPASFGQRFGARLLDGLIVTGLGIVALGLTFWLGLTAGGPSAVGVVTLLLAWLLLPSVVGMLYRVSGEGNDAGQTLGKAMCGIKVVRIDNLAVRPGKGKALGRYFVAGLGDSLFFLGSLSMLWAPDRRTWADKATQTAVVLTPKSSAGVARGSAGLTAAAMVVLSVALGAFAHLGGPSVASSVSAESDGGHASDSLPAGSDAGSNDLGATTDAPAQPTTLATTITAPTQAPTGKDGAGNPITYDPSNMNDGDPTTCWRMVGDGTNTSMGIALEGTHTITSVGLINGYTKTDPATGADRYSQERRIISVTWTFDDGTSMQQELDPNTTQLQSVTLPAPLSTASVTLQINATTAPGDVNYDYTAISEVDIAGV